MKSLVIVESPTKARTIQKFLGNDFVIKSSFGHVRDLPKRELGVDVEKTFEPKYIIPPKAKKVIDKLDKISFVANYKINHKKYNVKKETPIKKVTKQRNSRKPKKGTND